MAIRWLLASRRAEQPTKQHKADAAEEDDLQLHD
jgi:hypothetical protein